MAQFYAVANAPADPRIEVDAELQIFAPGAVGNDFADIIDEGFKVESRIGELLFVRLKLRQIQNIVDDRKQLLGGSVDGFEAEPLLRRHFCVRYQIAHPDDTVHGRSDFMAHIGQKL